MSRYALVLSYDGSGYSGWQRQKTAVTIQEEIEDALTKLLRQQTSIMGCGRTDAGVHAQHYVAHFDYDNVIDFDITFRLNHILSRKIAIQRTIPVADNFHARYNAVRREYIYYISSKKDPFHRFFELVYPPMENISFEKLEIATQTLLKYEDFFTFCKSNTDVKHTLCKIYQAEWTKIDDHHWQFKIGANRFLRGMVRLIVGMCLNVAQDKLSIEQLEHALEAKERLSRDYSVPARGLHLTKIVYPKELLPL